MSINITETANDLLLIIDDIKNNCKPFLQKERFLIYRGMFNSQDVATFKIKTDRKPRDTTRYMHDLMDEIFYDLYGSKIRSEAIFVTKTLGSAIIYGPEWVVFFPGKYDMYYSYKIHDLYVDFIGASLLKLMNTGVFVDHKETKKILAKTQEENDFIDHVYDNFRILTLQDYLRKVEEASIGPFMGIGKKLMDFYKMQIKEYFKKVYTRDLGNKHENELMAIVHDPSKEYYAIKVRVFEAVIGSSWTNWSPRKFITELEKQVRENPKAFD